MNYTFKLFLIHKLLLVLDYNAYSEQILTGSFGRPNRKYSMDHKVFAEIKLTTEPIAELRADNIDSESQYFWGMSILQTRSGNFLACFAGDTDDCIACGRLRRYCRYIQRIVIHEQIVDQSTQCRTRGTRRSRGGETGTTGAGTVVWAGVGGVGEAVTVVWAGVRKGATGVVGAGGVGGAGTIVGAGVITGGGPTVTAGGAVTVTRGRAGAGIVVTDAVSVRPAGTGYRKAMTPGGRGEGAISSSLEVGNLLQHPQYGGLNFCS